MATYSKNTNNLTKHSTIQLFIICLVLLLLPEELEAVSSTGKLVTHLPGLAVEPLPFHLETGYIGVGGSESAGNRDDKDNGDNYQLFYYFFKSERNPKEDPLILWLAGGPRCSALSAVLFEIGPVYMTHGEDFNGSLPGLTLNPNSWTKIANIIFLDQPVYSGFSYSKSSDDPIMTDTVSAKNTHEFLIKWLIQNPEFQSNPLYVSGNSYSGITVPCVVQNIIRDIEAGTHQFLNFKGYSLGNPVTNYLELESNSRVQFAYNMGLISYELYQSMRVNCNGSFLNFDLSNANCLPDRKVYEDLIAGINPSHVLEPVCPEATLTTFPRPKATTKYNKRRSLKKTTKGSSDESFHYSCWRLSELSENWANDAVVRKALHVREGTVAKWIRCNRGSFPYEVDIKSSIKYHQNISTKGYKTLIYSGDHDMEVPHISTEAWIRSLVNLSIIDEWRPWFVNGQIAGYTRSYSSGLTYATVKGAGHDTTGYNPDECYAMFERWISNTSL